MVAMNKHRNCKQQGLNKLFLLKRSLVLAVSPNKINGFLYFSDNFTKLTEFWGHALLCVKTWGLDLINTIVFCCIYHKQSYIWAVTLHMVFFLLSPVMCACLRLERVSLVNVVCKNLLQDELNAPLTISWFSGFDQVENGQDPNGADPDTTALTRPFVGIHNWGVWRPSSSLGLLITPGCWGWLWHEGVELVRTCTQIALSKFLLNVLSYASNGINARTELWHCHTGETNPIIWLPGCQCKAFGYEWLTRTRWQQPN